MSYSMDDYIDWYYETAMEAERDYDDFIEVAIELYNELKEVDNVIWKNYRELLLWSRKLKSSTGESLNRQFEQFKSLYHHSVAPRRCFIVKNRCYMMLTIRGIKVTLEKCKK